MTYKALRRVALALGWSENKTQGKGSHRTFTRKGYREITLPCHSESQEYQRGFTRQILTQILEPLDDVCQVPVKGVHSVEQVETLILELLDYLPAQVKQEYEKAIAEHKVALETYEAQQRVAINQSLQEYEAQRLQDCEATIRELESEQQSQGVTPDILSQALLFSTQERYLTRTQLTEVQATQQEVADQLNSTRQNLKSVQQSLAQRDATVEQLNQSLQTNRQKVQQLQRTQKRDRILMLGFLGISVCLGVVLIQREATRPRSPNAPLLDSKIEIRSHSIFNLSETPLRLPIIKTNMWVGKSNETNKPGLASSVYRA